MSSILTRCLTEESVKVFMSNATELFEQNIGGLWCYISAITDWFTWSHFRNKPFATWSFGPSRTVCPRPRTRSWLNRPISILLIRTHFLWHLSVWRDPMNLGQDLGYTEDQQLPILEVSTFTTLMSKFRCISYQNVAENSCRRLRQFHLLNDPSSTLCLFLIKDGSAAGFGRKGSASQRKEKKE